MRETPVCTAADAIYKLAAGNLKYLNAENGSGDISRRIRMSTWAKGQSPYAIIVTCSDSRVIPENIFSGVVMLVVSFMTSTLTTRIKKQEQLRMESETEKMRANLLRAVSHDLRTPLTLIKGYAETVRDLTGDDKAHRDEQMNIIVDEADRLTALVSSVMELSKVTSGTYKCERVHFDMGQLCDEVSERYDAICAQNGWQLQLELPEEELPVYADPDMMQRALHNLLGNAMHHIGQDGIFILRAFRCSEGVRVEVEDHGPGIAAADLPYIFDRYYRSRSDAGKQGTGLGLSITKAIFQQHSFRFGVQSTVGKGTTFWFVMSDLPYVDDFEGK